jgi:hypothetical protein
MHRITVEKLEKKRPLGRPRHRWEDNIETDLSETGIKVVDHIELSQCKV